MKLGFKIVFWTLSVALAFLAFVFFFGGALPGVLMLFAAVVINPLFIQGVQLKKGLTALLTIGLFIASVAVLPGISEDRAKQSEVLQSAAIAATDLPKNASLQKLAQDSTVERSVAASTSALPTVTTVPARIDTPNPTSTPKPTATPTPTGTTPAPVPTPTSKPTPTKTPVPTPTPTMITRAKAAGIEVLDYTDVVNRGSKASIKIQGEPNTDYTCEVEYKSGMSTADGLGTKTSNAQGVVSWSWKVGSRTSLNYTPTIYVSGGGDSISVTFEVVE